MADLELAELWRWPGSPPPGFQPRADVYTSPAALKSLCEYYRRVYYPEDRFDPGAGERAGVLLGRRTRLEGERWCVQVLGFEETTYRDTSELHLMGDTRALYEAGKRGRERLGLPSSVGWYHTHPEGPIYLSPPDLQTFQAIFPDPWQTAMVVDPSRWRAGYFVRGPGSVLDSSVADWREFRVDV